MKWKATHYPICRMKRSDVVNNSLSIKMRDFKVVKCDFCDLDCVDYCYNCEQPICGAHSHILCFMMIHNRPAFILSICPRCFKDNDFENTLFVYDAY